MGKFVPIVDITNCGLLIDKDSDVELSALTEAGNKLYEAFTTSGFAYLSNHGIPSEEVDTFNAVTEKFFTLPDDVKRQYYVKTLKFGYDPIETVMANPKGDFDYNEGYRISGAGMVDDKTPWPEDPAFRKIFLELAELCKRLSFRILHAIGIGMKLKDPKVLIKFNSLANKAGNMTTLKALRYPPITTDDTLKKKQLRTGEHKDTGVISLLFQDNNGGLQVQNFGGEFEDVPPVPGTIVVNVADLLEILSGGRLKSGVHRVVLPKDPKKKMNVRKSIVYFLMADDDVLLDELEFETPTVKTGISTNVHKMTVKEEMVRRFTESFY